MSEIIRHGSEVVRGEDRITLDDRGWTTTRIYRGTKTALRNLQLDLSQRGWRSRFAGTGPGAELHVEVPEHADQQNDLLQPDEIWTLRRQEYRRDLASHPMLDSVANKTKVIAEVDDLIEDGKGDEVLDGAYHSNVKLYAGYRLIGQHYFVMYTPVINRTVTAAPASNIRAEFAVSALPRVVQAGEINAPSGIMYSVPSGWEWLDVPPDVRQTSDRFRYRVEKQWIGAEKWANIYPGGTGTPDSVGGTWS